MSVHSAVLFVNLHKAHSADMAERIAGELEKRNITALVFAFEGEPETPPSGEWDVAFTLGGDGTVLYAARVLAGLGVPIFPVNLGTLGFIAGVERGEWLDVFERWLRGETPVSRRCMLEVGVNRGGTVITGSICLNDAVISASGIAKLIKLDVHGEVAPGDWIELGFYRADGLIIATPTGSTAYSMAAGGPILDPQMEAMLLTPICPFTLSNRPLVLPSKQALRITVGKEQRSGVLLTVDGQHTFELIQEDCVVIRQAPRQALLISPNLHTYYSALRTKLSWTGTSGGGNGGSFGGDHA